MNEFDIIKNYFYRQPFDDVKIGIGDDAAVIKIPAQHELAITTDTLIPNVHFPIETSPEDIGYKSLAVNLSDLAAMGAKPTCITLSLSLPEKNAEWLQKFSAGLFTLIDEFNLQLIGGDLVHGPLAITIQAMGILPENKRLLRSTAKVGDLIYVTGSLGAAGYALKCWSASKLSSNDAINLRLNRPAPRVKEGMQLLEIASAAIDISDGLAADLSHILEQSQVGAAVNVDALPAATLLTEYISRQEMIELALTAGDDYELCFTVAPENKFKLKQIDLALTCIGTITNTGFLHLHYKNGNEYHGDAKGYRHF